MSEKCGCRIKRPNETGGAGDGWVMFCPMHLNAPALIEELTKALQEILDYGKALQPGPVHPVTFTACVIAEQALTRSRTVLEATK